MDKHKQMLTYYNSDDGIWLVCACGHEKHLGHAPLIEAALAAALAHAMEVRSA